jgi:hypothetical protein
LACPSRALRISAHPRKSCPSVVKNCLFSLGCACKNDFAKEECRETSVQVREPLNQLPATSYFSQCFNDFANH